MSWGRVSDVDGYRIYELVGTSPVLLGTVGSNATGVLVTGLTAGKPTQFMVEAFGESIVADSSWVTVTTSRRRR